MAMENQVVEHMKQNSKAQFRGQDALCIRKLALLTRLLSDCGTLSVSPMLQVSSVCHIHVL